MAADQLKWIRESSYMSPADDSFLQYLLYRNVDAYECSPRQSRRRI